jgi:hypothetical protein
VNAAVKHCFSGTLFQSFRWVGFEEPYRVVTDGFPEHRVDESENVGGVRVPAPPEVL